MESSTTRATFDINKRGRRTKTRPRSESNRGIPGPQLLNTRQRLPTSPARARGSETCLASRRRRPLRHGWGWAAARLDLLILRALFDVHVLELARFEDLAAFLALDEFRILITAHDLHTRMLTRLFHAGVLRRDGRLCGHTIRIAQEALAKRGDFRRNFRYFRSPVPLVKPLPRTLS